MSEKTWLQSSNMLTDGYGTVYYARTVKDARRLWEILVSQTYGLNALTSERDEAVRVAGELRAIAADLRKHLGFVLAMTRYEDHSNGVVYQGMDEGEVISSRIIADADEAVAHYDSLTASTGGSSDEPQKEIRE